MMNQSPRFNLFGAFITMGELRRSEDIFCPWFIDEASASILVMFSEIVRFKSKSETADTWKLFFRESLKELWRTVDGDIMRQVYLKSAVHQQNVDNWMMDSLFQASVVPFWDFETTQGKRTDIRDSTLFFWLFRDTVITMRWILCLGSIISWQSLRGRRISRHHADGPQPIELLNWVFLWTNNSAGLEIASEFSRFGSVSRSIFWHFW
jgi:hypothetical protein